MPGDEGKQDQTCCQSDTPDYLFSIVL